MTSLTSSSLVAGTTMAKFPCLLIFSFKYTAFFFNTFNIEVMAMLAKISVFFF